MTRKDSYHRSRVKAYDKRQRKRRNKPSRWDIYSEQRRLNRKRRDELGDE